jgi:hypothetical protein
LESRSESGSKTYCGPDPESDPKQTCQIRNTGIFCVGKEKKISEIITVKSRLLFILDPDPTFQKLFLIRLGSISSEKKVVKSVFKTAALARFLEAIVRRCVFDV